MKRSKLRVDLKQVKSPEASQLRQRKYRLMQRYPMRDDLLPGSVSQSRFRCGKATCHCAQEGGHPSWSWTFMVEGKKRVEHLPASTVQEIQKRVAAGREFQEAVKDVLAANARLWVLEHKGRKKRR